MLSLAGDYVVSLMLGWPGALLGVLLLIYLIEQSLDRRFFVSTRVKLVFAAVILVVGAITVRPSLPAPGDVDIQRARELREQRARDVAAHDAQEQPRHDGDSDERLKSEVDSLRKELETERPRQR